jgi:hypothetical protein
MLQWYGISLLLQAVKTSLMARPIATTSNKPSDKRMTHSNNLEQTKRRMRDQEQHPATSQATNKRTTERKPPTKQARNLMTNESIVIQQQTKQQI